MRPRDCRADVYRVGSCASPRWCSPSVVGGGARVCRGGGGPLRFVFPGVVGEAVAAATSWNNAPTPPRPGGASLRCRRRVWELLFRSPGWSCVVLQVMLFLALFVKDAGCAVGVADGGRLDLARVSRGDGGRQRRAKIQELEALGRSPGRCATAKGFFYFDSNKSRCAMGLL